MTHAPFHIPHSAFRNPQSEVRIPSSEFRILIVRLSAIGDVVHTLPCLHALREAFPKAHIGWVVEELSAPLLEGHPEIDELFVIPKKRWRAHPLRPAVFAEKKAFYAWLRSACWDVAIDFQGLAKSAWVAWRSGAPRRIGFAGEDGRELSRLFSNERVMPDPARPHVIERNLALLEPLGVRAPRVEWRFPDFGSERESLAPFFQSNGMGEAGRYVALYPGAGWETKRWPAEHFAQLARLLSEDLTIRKDCPRDLDCGSSAVSAQEGPRRLPVLPLVLVWGPSEEALCREIVKRSGLGPNRLVLTPTTNLRELAVVLERAAVVVGGDTGPVHLAAALGVPVVGIYGGSDPARNGPWGAANRVLMSDSTPCVPCWRTRCNRALRLECMKAIRPETVRDAVGELLG